MTHNLKDWNNPEETDSEEEEHLIQPQTEYELSDLELITTIGIGAFGRVELIRPVGDETRSFALKRMSKMRIVEQGKGASSCLKGCKQLLDPFKEQQEHIKNEKTLLMTLNNDFIVKCYQSFR